MVREPNRQKDTSGCPGRRTQLREALRRRRVRRRAEQSLAAEALRPAATYHDLSISWGSSVPPPGGARRGRSPRACTGPGNQVPAAADTDRETVLRRQQ